MDDLQKMFDHIKKGPNALSKIQACALGTFSKEQQRNGKFMEKFYKAFYGYLYSKGLKFEKDKKDWNFNGY